MDSKLGELIKLARLVPELRQEEAAEYLRKPISDSKGNGTKRSKTSANAR
jgi:hypothetical protein